jgi:hypothetical protein
MRMKMFFVAAAFSMLATAAQALPISQGGTGFTCHPGPVYTPWCQCEGSKTGTDCAAMKKNCKKGKMNCDAQGCTCAMAAAANPGAPKAGKVGGVPPAGGILEGDRGFSPTGPAQTGRGAAPAGRAAPGRIN